jgi:hypothetical protein
MENEKQKDYRNILKSTKIRIFFAVSIILLFLISFVWSLSIQNKDDIPIKNYSTDNVIILAYQRTMIGGYNILIYGNGTAYYAPTNCSKSKAGRLSQEKVTEIINLFKENDFYNLKNQYGHEIQITDLGSDNVTIIINNVTKSVDVYGLGGPSSFREIVNKLRNATSNLPNVTENNSYELCHAMTTEFGRFDKDYYEANYDTIMDDCMRCFNSSYLP